MHQPPEQQPPKNGTPLSSSPKNICIRLRKTSQSSSPPTNIHQEIQPFTIDEIRAGTKRGEITLTAELIKNIPESELLDACVGDFNLLDLAIMNHSFENIQFLVPKYIHPDSCKINCFVQLFRVQHNLNKDNITAITKFLIAQKCTIPDEKDLEQKGSPRANPTICVGDFYKDAKETIAQARPQSKESVKKYQIN